MGQNDSALWEIKKWLISTDFFVSESTDSLSQKSYEIISFFDFSTL